MRARVWGRTVGFPGSVAHRRTCQRCREGGQGPWGSRKLLSDPRIWGPQGGLLWASVGQHGKTLLGVCTFRAGLQVVLGSREVTWGRDPSHGSAFFSCSPRF